MLYFVRIIFFLVFCLYARDSFAEAVLTTPLDLGVIKFENTTAPAVLRYQLTNSAPECISNCTVRGGQKGIVLVTSDTEVLEGQVVFNPYGTTHAVPITCTPSGSVDSEDFVIQLETKHLSPGQMTEMHVGVSNATIPAALATSSGLTCNGNFSYSYGYYTSWPDYYNLGTVTMPITFKISEYIPPITITNRQNLNFGTVFGDVSHDVTINPATGEISSTNPGAIISSRLARVGIFNIVKEDAGSQAVTLSLSPTVHMTSPLGGAASTYIDIAASPDPSAVTSVGQGTTVINVGGTLHIFGNEISGIYSGSYVLTVNY